MVGDPCGPMWKENVTATVADLELGEGIYSFAEASRILSHRGSETSKRQLRYWMKSGLTPPSHTDADDRPILSFLDLISLEVVGRFRRAGMSLQQVRKFEGILREEFSDLERPFAYKLFYSDGASVWAERIGEDGSVVVELMGKRSDRQHKHLAWTDAIASFAHEIEFENDDQRAVAWDLTPWVRIDPQIQFGQPVVTGTRVPVRTVLANLDAGTPAQVADWYDLTVEQVTAVRDYDAVH